MRQPERRRSSRLDIANGYGPREHVLPLMSRFGNLVGVRSEKKLAGTTAGARKARARLGCPPLSTAVGWIAVPIPGRRRRRAVGIGQRSLRHR